MRVVKVGYLFIVLPSVLVEIVLNNVFSLSRSKLLVVKCRRCTVPLKSQRKSCGFALFDMMYSEVMRYRVYFWFPLQFDSDYEEFKQSIDGLKQQLQLFVDSWFEKPLSVSAILVCFLHVTLQP